MAAKPSSTHSPKFHPPPFPESNEFSLSSSSQPSRFHFFLWESDAGVTKTTTMKTSSFRFSRSRLGASPSPPPPLPFALYGIPSMTTVGFPYRENKDFLSLSFFVQQRQRRLQRGVKYVADRITQGMEGEGKYLEGGKSSHEPDSDPTRLKKGRRKPDERNSFSHVKLVIHLLISVSPSGGTVSGKDRKELRRRRRDKN